MGNLTDAIKELLPRTTDPSSASRDPSGAREARAPDRKERREGDYLPVIALGIGALLVVVAVIRPQPLPSLALPVLGENRPLPDEDRNFDYE